MAAGVVLAFAVAGTAHTEAPSSADCTGQFFSSHAQIVPETDGELSVGGFVSETASGTGTDFGQEISDSRSLPRNDCCL